MKVPVASVALALALVACSGKSAREWNEVGIAHSEAGRPEQAMAAFAQAVKLEPSVPTYRFNLGRAYFQMRHYDAAETQLREVLRLDPGDAEASRLLSYAVARIQARGLP